MALKYLHVINRDSLHDRQMDIPTMGLWYGELFVNAKNCVVASVL